MKFKNMEKPRRLEWDQDSLTETYGKCYVEPFERGYGITVGNALRRILLSSIPSAAITSAKIDGVLHEFSTAPGVVEDITQILMNLKQVRLIYDGEEPKLIRLQVEGEREVRARDIETDETMKVLNPDLHIATLNSREAKLAIEMRVEVGRGYVPSENLKREDQAIGEVALDAIFSPIKRVKFNVENTRVGQMTDYEKLVMEIWTDGRVKPQDVLTEAVRLYKEHLAIFDHEEEVKAQKSMDNVDEEKEKLKELLTKSVEELEFSVRAANCLRNANIKTIGDLVQKTEAEMLKYRNFGRKSLTEIKEVLAEMNLSLGMKTDSAEE